MAEQNMLDDDRIQDYIDDRLSDSERASVAAFLLANPKVGAEVDRLRRHNEALKSIGQEILEEPVPERLRSALRQQSEPSNVTAASFVPATPRFRFLEAAAALLLFVVGLASGWIGNDVLRPVPSEDDLALASLAQTFSQFGADRDFPIEFPPDRKLELASWIQKSFDQEIVQPDLEAFAYRYIGGRLVPGAKGKIGTFMFEDRSGNRVAVFFWPRPAPPKKVIELSRQENIETRFWFGDGFGFAVVGDDTNADMQKIADHVFKHYEQSRAGQS